MKVLIITDSLRGGGKERRIGELIKGIIKYDDIGFKIVTMENDVAYLIFNELKIPILFLIRKRKKDISIIFKLYKICKEYKPDIIHSWDSMTAVYAAVICKILRLRHLNGMITIAPEKLNRLSKTYIQAKCSVPFSDIICSNSFAGLKSFRIPKLKGEVIYNGFDLNRLTKLDDEKTIRERYNLGENIIISMVASFTNYKDWDLYLSAAEEISKRNRNVLFLAIGDGPNLNNYIEMYRNNFKIKFLGRVEKVESFINLSTICLLLSNTKNFGEGISNSILEYMALKKPSIATNYGGNKEVIADGISGYLIEPNDLKTLVKKILFLLDNPEKAKEIGEKGFEVVKTKFDYNKFIVSYSNLYKKLVNQNNINV